MSEPHFVKTASQAEQYGDASTPLGCFADPQGRRFPFHTPAATWRSAMATREHLNGADYHDALRKAAAIHGIDAAVEEVLSPTGQMIKYAYEAVDDKGQLHQHLPLRNGTEVQKAAEWVDHYRPEVRLGVRQKIAAAILDAALHFSAELEPTTKHELLKQAGRGECTLDSLKQALLSRANILGDSVPETAQLRKMAAAAKDRGQREVRQKLAAMLDQLDRDYHLTPYYKQGLRTPEEALFGITNVTLKKAEASEVLLVTGAVYSKQALERVTRRSLQDWLGDDVADSVWSMSNAQEVDHVKLAHVVQEFDNSHAIRFEQCAQVCGIKPLSTRPVPSAV